MFSQISQSSSSAYFQTFRVFVLVIALILAGFYLLSSILLPVIISFTLYALVEPFVHYLVRKNINHSLAIILVLILLMSVSVLAISFALPQFLNQAALLKAKLPGILESLELFLTRYSSQIGNYFGVEIDVSNILVSLLSQSSSVGNALLVNLSEQVVAITFGMILVPILTYFILRDYKGWRNGMLNWLPNSSFELGWLIYQRVTKQLQNYTRGVMLQSLIMAVVASLGFTLIGLDIPVLLGIITGLLNLVPYLGPLISMALALLVASAMTPFDPSLLYLSVLVVITAQIVDNVAVIPLLIANSVDLHPVLVIVGIIIFGSLFGTIGVILAIPAIAAAKIIFNNLYSDIYNASRKRI